MKNVKWEDRPLTHDWARVRAWRGKKVHAIDWPNSGDSDFSLISYCEMPLELGTQGLGSRCRPFDDYSNFVDGLMCCGDCVDIIRKELELV